MEINMATYNEIPCDGEIHDPPHPGEVLKGLHMDPLNLTIKEVAEHLDVDRKTVSRLINRHTGITAEMAIRLSKAFNTTPDLWMNMQTNYDLWHAKQRTKDTIRVQPFTYNCEARDNATYS
jgi:antitoxin HigA-1